MDSLYHFSFYFASGLVAPIWLMMIFLPNWSFTRKLMSSLWVVLPFALTYAIGEIPHYIEAIPVLAFPRFDKINALLYTVPGTSQGWVHFITMDLFAGRWAYLDSRKHGFNQTMMSFLFASMLVFGPSGLSLYLIIRYFKLKTLSTEIPASA